MLRGSRDLGAPQPSQRESCWKAERLIGPRRTLSMEEFVTKFGTSKAALAVILIAASILGAGCSRPPETFQSKLKASPKPLASAATTPSAPVGTPGATLPVEPQDRAAPKQKRGGKTSGDAEKPAAPQPTRKPRASEDAPTASIVVNFVNGTSSKPLENTVIGVGRATYRPDLQRRSTRGVLSPVPVAETVALAVYPDGRSGSRVAVPLTIAADDGVGESENVVYIVVSDQSVQVRGAMASGPQTRTYPRF